MRKCLQDFLATESMDDLVSVLRKARLDARLMDMFPPHKRTLADFEEHFKVPPCTNPQIPQYLQYLLPAGLDMDHQSFLER